LSGVVAHGDERGRRIGFPTANLAGIPEMLPPHGVYGVFVDELEPGRSARRLGAGVTNVGVRPTIGGSARTVETHLFDFSGDLYDRPLRLHLALRIREEKKFGSIEELVAQIGRDAAEARRRLALVPAAWPVENEPS
jgi:riboflavin kinase/FMN adenylyltransferase